MKLLRILVFLSFAIAQENEDWELPIAISDTGWYPSGSCSGVNPITFESYNSENQCIQAGICTNEEYNSPAPKGMNPKIQGFSIRCLKD